MTTVKACASLYREVRPILLPQRRASRFSRIPLRGAGTLVLALVALGALAYFAPVFSVISLGIGLVVALILHFWHKRRPVEEPEIKKRPLGLS